MTNPYILEPDVLNGKSGSAVMQIEGRNIPMFSVKKITCEYSFNEADVPVVGTTLVQKKQTGVTLTGSMTIYSGTPEFLRMLANYMTSGQLPYFTIMLTNDDPTTSIGVQRITIHNVKISSGIIAQLDADAEFLTEDVSFSYTSFTIHDEFHEPARLGG